jgi:hypothetical protein
MPDDLDAMLRGPACRCGGRRASGQAEGSNEPAIAPAGQEG